jgi:signal transduction histidine kinase
VITRSTGSWPWADRLTRRALTLDAALALFAFGLGVVIVLTGGLGEPDPGTRDGDLLGVVLVAIATLPLAARSVTPAVVLVIVTGALVPLGLLHYPGEVSNAALLAVYSLASQRDREPRRAMALAVAAFVAIAASFAIAQTDGFPAAEIATIGAVWLFVWVAGDRGRLRRERMAELEERARQAERDAERERRLAAAEERTRIARELHDSAGHAMNVILVEAGAARLLRDRDPERSRGALETIEHVARGTIGEIDQLVRHLRDDGAIPDRLAAPGVHDLDGLVERHRAAGLEVEARVEGRPRPLHAALDRAAYRIVQEALLNAARHGSGTAELVLSFGPETLDINVTNPVSAGASVREGGGHGMVGMRERAHLLGGGLDARAEGGRFRVDARLPYGESDA